MNIISCDSCGILLDISKIPEPDIWKEDSFGGQEIDTSCAEWDGSDFIPVINCPLCKEPVKYVQK